MRTTKDDLCTLLVLVGRYSGRNDLTLEKAYGGYRLCRNTAPHGGSVEISPRLSYIEMVAYMRAMLDAFELRGLK